MDDETKYSESEYLLVGQGHYRALIFSTLKILINPPYCPSRSILMSPLCSPPPILSTQIFTWWVYHTFWRSYGVQ